MTDSFDRDQAAGLRHAPSAGGGLKLPERLRCIAVSSGKGGVGKTVLSVGLGCCLSRMNKKVLILDADLGLANVDIQMGFDPGRTLQDAVFGTCSLDDVVVKTTSGPDVLVSSSGAPEMVDMGGARVDMFVQELIGFAAKYDYLIIDVAAGIGRNIRSFLAASPEVLVVVANEPTSVMDAYSVVKVLCRGESPPEIMMAVNMVDSVAEGELLAERLNGIVRRFLHRELPVAGIVVRDRVVGDAIRARRPLVDYAEGSVASQCIADTAEYLASRQARARAEGTLRKDLFREVLAMGNPPHASTTACVCPADGDSGAAGDEKARRTA